MSLPDDDRVPPALELQAAITEYLQNMFSGISIPRGELDVNVILGHLSSITEKELEDLGHKESTCSVCMQPFVAILAEEETANAMESPAIYSGELGVVKLSQPWQCGHLFCRRDIVKWVNTGKSTCPMCRQSLLDPEGAPSTREAGEVVVVGEEGEASQSGISLDAAELRPFSPGPHIRYFFVRSNDSGHSTGAVADDGQAAPPGMYS